MCVYVWVVGGGDELTVYGMSKRVPDWICMRVRVHVCVV